MHVQNDNLQNDLQVAVNEAEEAKDKLVANRDALGNYAYICAAGDYILAICRANPSFNLAPLFEELVEYMIENPLGKDPLPLLDMVDFGCVFPAEFNIVADVDPSTEQPAVENTGQSVDENADQVTPEIGGDAEVITDVAHDGAD